MGECRHCGRELYGMQLCEDSAACEERASGECPSNANLPETWWPGVV